MVSEAQQAQIDYRRQQVARLLARGMTLREIVAQLAAMSVTDPATGASVPVFRNPETGEPYGLTTIGEDAKYARGLWEEDVAREAADNRAEVLAVLRELRRVGFAVGDLRAVAASLKQQRDLLGLDAPKKTDVAAPGPYPGIYNVHDTALDVIKEVCAELGFPEFPEPERETS